MTVQATYVCASAMIVEAILSLHRRRHAAHGPVVGNIMAEGRALCRVKPYIVFFPAAFLSVTVLAVNLLGDGLRDALESTHGKAVMRSWRQKQGSRKVKFTLICIQIS